MPLHTCNLATQLTPGLTWTGDLIRTRVRLNDNRASSSTPVSSANLLKGFIPPTED